jgi:hypothetical protein
MNLASLVAPRSAARPTGLFENGELVGELRGDQDAAGDGRGGTRRRQVGESVQRSHSRLVDTVADARAVPARDDEGGMAAGTLAIASPAYAGGGVDLQRYGCDIQAPGTNVVLRHWNVNSWKCFTGLYDLWIDVNRACALAVTSTTPDRAPTTRTITIRIHGAADSRNLPEWPKTGRH